MTSVAHSENAYDRNLRLYPLSRCRCGADVERDSTGIPSCPNNDKPGELRVYHDICLQNIATPRFWKVVPEGELFRPYAGYDRCSRAFATEQLAWAELEEAYEDRADWVADA